MKNVNSVGVRQTAVTRVIKEHAGGTQSRASVAVVDGDTRFLKSQRPSRHGTSPNFEADFLAHDLFEMVGIRAPEAELIRLSPAGPLTQDLGDVVLSTEFVDTEFTGGEKVRGIGWSVPEDAYQDAFFNMTLVDLVMGNADRRSANFFVQKSERGLIPIPIDNDSGFGNLANQNCATNHCNFILSYDGAGSTPGLRQNGKVANHFIDTIFHRDLLDEPEERERILHLAGEFQKNLSDQKIEQMVERLPAEVIPEGAKVEYYLPETIDPTTAELLTNGATEGLAGAGLFAFRKAQLKKTLAWRRDHLVDALKDYFAQLEDPNIDPLQVCSDDWKRLGHGSA